MAKWTPEKVRDAVANVLMGEVGYVSGNYERSKYGQAKHWRSPWQWGTAWDGYWCNRFLSWGVDQVCGAKAGVAAVGRQSGTALPVGFAATWLQRDWFRANGRHVGWQNAQRGDYVLFKLYGPRSANATNHVGMFIRWADGGPSGRAVVLEGNLPHPTDRSRGIGVHYHARPLDGQIVAVYRPDWAAAAKVLNAAEPKPKPKPEPKPAPKPPPPPKPEPAEPKVPDMSAHRIAGSDRYATAVEVSKRRFPNGADRVYLAGSNALTDQAVAAGFSDGPVLPVRDPLPAVVTAEIKRLKPTDVLAVGGSTVVPDKVIHAARKAAGL